MYNNILILLLFFCIFETNSQVLRDPTQPAGTKGVSGSQSDNQTDIANLILSAVFISKENTRAVINGRNLVPGDVVQGATVLKIETGAVTLLHEQQEHTLYVKKQPQEIKSDVSNRF